MKFVNEQTYENFFHTNRKSEFHKKFEIEISGLKKQLSDKNIYPIVIENKKIFSKNKFKHVSPIDKRIILGYISIASEKEIKKAVKASDIAFKKWASLDYTKRIAILKKAVIEIRNRKFELSALLTFENGKNRYEAMADIDEAIDFINYYCFEMEFNKGFVSNNYVKNKREQYLSVMKPYGVWGIISPFNFPAAIFVGMTTGALITGNTVIVKPASNTPIIGYKIIEILVKTGIPPGVLNFITGSGKSIGNLLVGNRNVAGILFTGSKEIGSQIVRDSSKITLRPIIAELGGKNPVIVTGTANLDKAVNGVTKAAFSYSGQKCSACSRVYVHKKVKNEFLTKLIKNVENLNILNPVNEESDIGPLINKDAYQKYKQFTKIASKKGKILFGGSIRQDGELKYGYYVEPTIVTNISEKSSLAKKELFLPLVIVTEYKNFENAIKMANSSEFGLTAGIYSNDQREIDLFLRHIESGVVYVNRAKGATTGAMVGQQSFGGWKNSGTSGKGTGGKYYLSQFMREQSQTLVS